MLSCQNVFLSSWVEPVPGFIQAQIQGLFKDKFILFKALLNNNAYTQYEDYVTFRALSPTFVKSISFFTLVTITFLFTRPYCYPLVKFGPFPAIDIHFPITIKKISNLETCLLKSQEYHATILFLVNGIDLFT